MSFVSVEKHQASGGTLATTRGICTAHLQTSLITEVLRGGSHIEFNQLCLTLCEKAFKGFIFSFIWHLCVHLVEINLALGEGSGSEGLIVCVGIQKLAETFSCLRWHFRVVKNHVHNIFWLRNIKTALTTLFLIGIALSHTHLISLALLLARHLTELSAVVILSPIAHHFSHTELIEF